MQRKEVKLRKSNYANENIKIVKKKMSQSSNYLEELKKLLKVVGFISRPIMHLRKKSDGRDVKPHKSYTFTEAIENYGQLIYAADLENAYTRAGSAFKGVMQQNFVVLHDKATTGTFGPAPRGSGYPRRATHKTVW